MKEERNLFIFVCVCTAATRVLLCSAKSRSRCIFLFRANTNTVYQRFALRESDTCGTSEVYPCTVGRVCTKVYIFIVYQGLANTKLNIYRISNI